VTIVDLNMYVFIVMINFTSLNQMVLVFKWKKTKIFPVYLQTNILKSYIKRVPYSSDFDDHMIAILVLCMTEK